MLEEGGDGENGLGKVGKSFPVVGKNTRERMDLLEVGGHAHFGEIGSQRGIRINSGRGDGVGEKVGVGGISMCFERRQLKFVLAKAAKESADVEDVCCLFRIEDSNTVQLGGDASGIFDDLVYAYNEPTGNCSYSL